MTVRPPRPRPANKAPTRRANVALGARDVAHMRALVDAIMHPAAIIHPDGDTVEIVAQNARYDQFLQDDHAAPREIREDRRNRWGSQIRAVAKGEKEEFRFDLAYAGMLGQRTYSASVSRIALPGVDLPLALFTAIDRSEASRIEQVLRRELLTDTLTSLPNRPGFLEKADTREAKAEGNTAIVIVDLMRFSRINESLGSIAGDEIIITTARRIKSILRSTDMLGRVGGNEFAIHAVSVRGVDDVMQIARRVREALEAPILTSTYAIAVEGAIGCALSDDSEDAEELFRRAQAAVKQSKRSGVAEIHRPATLIEAQERFHLESRLRDALERDALHLAFQPFVSLETGKVEGFEALARWTDEDMGVVPPVKFIPVAEESGLILPLGRWVMRESAATLARWDAMFGGPVPLTLNLNVSPVQIARDDVAGCMRGALADAGIDGSRLTVEVTESALVDDVAKAKSVLEALKTMKLSIAMDDFGTGFSNLANLQILPIDVLKIDRSFVHNMVGDPDKIAIVRAILSLAGTLGMKTVAEGIETMCVGQALARLGCDRGQGYHYARPMSSDDAYAYWRQRYRASSPSASTSA
ncbi:MAG: bifunctional diguanylate cyclase/phosphodiesterase [Sphingobium sp.]